MHPEPPRRSSRYLMLDLWRGFAATWVVLLHATYFVDAPPATSAGQRIAALGVSVLRSGWYGVPIFFVISGYCIAATSDSHARKRGSVVEFFKKRLRRIYPPYLAALVLVVAWCTIMRRLLDPSAAAEEFLTPPLGTADLGIVVGNLTLTEVWIHHLIGGHATLFLDPSWSLMYEEQFYLVCGLALVFLGRRFLIGTGVVSLLVVTALLLTRGTWPEPMTGFFFDGRWLTFAMGLAVYVGLNRFGVRGQRILLLAFVALSIWLYLLRSGRVGVVHSHTQLVYLTELVVGSVFSVLLLAFHRWDEAWRWRPVLRPVAYLGRISYSLYIVHIGITSYGSYALAKAGLTGRWQVLLVVVPLCAAASIGAAALFFEKVERRFLNSPDAVIPLHPPSG